MAIDGRLPRSAACCPALAHALPAAALIDELRAQLDARGRLGRATGLWMATSMCIASRRARAVVAELLRRYPVGRVGADASNPGALPAPWRIDRQAISFPLGAGLHRQLHAARIPANDGFSGLRFSIRPFGDKKRRFLRSARPLLHSIRQWTQRCCAMR